MRYLGVVASLAVASVFFACGGDDANNGGGPGTTAGAGGEESETPAGGRSSTGATSSMGGEEPNPDPDPDPVAGAGAGGEAPLGPASMGTPRNGLSQVVDGVVARSENFTMILSVGEEPGGNVSMNSSQYRINLGVVGSTQK